MVHTEQCAFAPYRTRTMTFLLASSAFLWISFGLPLVPEFSEACLDFQIGCYYKFGNITIEFVGSAKTWSQARSTCMANGGKLLGILNDQMMSFLDDISQGRNTNQFSWWLGKQIQKEGQKPITTIGDLSNDHCTYLRLNPLQVLMSDCNQTRGFLCSHDVSLRKKKSALFPQHQRSKTGVDIMGANLGDIHIVLEAAMSELRRIETTPGEPMNDVRDDFIKYLLEATQNLDSTFTLHNKTTISQIITCTIGILHLSLMKCDLDQNPNPLSLFESIFDIFWEISFLLETDLGELFVFKHALGTLYQITLLPEDLGNLVLGSVEDGELVKFPSFAALAPHLQGYSKVTAQLSTLSYNPHPTHENISGVLSKVVINGDGSNIRLMNLAERIQIYLPRPNATKLLNNTIQLTKETQSVSTMNITDPEMTVIFSTEPCHNVSLKVSLSYGSPTAKTDNTAILNETVGFRWLITPEMMRQTPGSWFVTTTVLKSDTPNVTLTITSFMIKCMFWDTERNKWSIDGCLVGEDTTPDLVQCLCNHLTLFGSSFFVMPNYVDISRTAELFATVTKNYVVLALLCSFFGVYLLTLLWACYADRRAWKRRKMTLLEGNHPGALYNYLISVQTGHRKNAGTSANVTAVLTGSEGETSLHDLTDPDKKLFERGNTDMFILATPFPLGDLQALRLQHNNSGSHPAWYINKVVVQDLQTHYVWHFLCNCWLSDDKDDGITKKTFNAANNHEIKSFRNIFQSRTWTGFRDEHIWVSIVDPPSRSPFTRVQRVSCCMCLLLCTMAINIAFWNLPEDSNLGVIFSIGSFKLTWQEIIVGIESGLLMFPINILIITIFRSIRPRIVSKKSKKEDKEKADAQPSAVTVPTLLRDAEEFISLTCNFKRNQMSEIPHLETTADLLAALDKLHVLIQNIQGEIESDPHWVHCSRFLLAGLCHLLLGLKQLDEKHFSSSQEHQQILALTNLLVSKSEMVFSCHLTNCPSFVEKKKNSACCWLPWWCVFLGWFLLVSISGISTFFTLLYGFEYGKKKSIQWVLSLGLSLFQSIFILQPLKVIGIAVFFALLLKPVAVEESEEVELMLKEQQHKCKLYTGRETL